MYVIHLVVSGLNVKCFIKRVNVLPCIITVNWLLCYLIFMDIAMLKYTVAFCEGGVNEMSLLLNKINTSPSIAIGLKCDLLKTIIHCFNMECKMKDVFRQASGFEYTVSFMSALYGSLAPHRPTDWALGGLCVRVRVCMHVRVRACVWCMRVCACVRACECVCMCMSV